MLRKIWCESKKNSYKEEKFEPKSPREIVLDSFILHLSYLFIMYAVLVQSGATPQAKTQAFMSEISSKIVMPSLQDT